MDHLFRQQIACSDEGSLFQTRDRLCRHRCMHMQCTSVLSPTFSPHIRHHSHNYRVRQEVGTVRQTSRHSTKSCSTYTVCHTCQHIHTYMCMYTHTQSPLPSLPTPHHSLHPSPSFPPRSPPLIPPLSATHLPAEVMDERRQSREHITSREGDLVL